ncbi:NYN domain-containing protein [Alteraurantiacibacter aquimixticola]|uniref:NYN domain-containing protein n=1 Tax=Alteraurantiacibacter aquimixticola TaxID=2489173 RepID=A0A4T3EZH6_9SPHN|nr:NYN domain-containing protein [Alteraurantiacibacter aquimixticola]TIX50034.1 NYN domain-containing protein [Alteraurantiacibacter aquimixticola]
MPEAELKNIALLIDADNASHAGIDPVLTVLAELGQVNIRRAYGNWAKPALSNWNKITHRYGLQPVQQFDLTKGKNATDMAMTIDAVDMLYDGKVDGFGIMSSDSDFTPLVTRLRQDGLIVYGFGSDKAPEAFKTACTRYIDVDQLIRTSQADDSKSGASASEFDKELIALLGAAWKASSRDDEGFARLHEVGQIAGNRSSFDVRNYGFKRLSDLMRAASDHFLMERRDDKQLYVKRLR